MKEIDYKISRKIDLKNTKDEKKLHDVYVYISYKGRRKYFNTGVKCKLKHFNNRVVGVADAQYYNSQIEDTEREIKNLVQRVLDEYGTFDIDLLGKVKTHIEDREENFLVWVTKKMPTEGMADGTLRNNRATVQVLREFGLELFTQLTLTNIERFDLYLHKQNYSYDTIFKHHAKLRSFIRKAIIAGYPIQDVYSKFKLKRPKPTKLKYLEESELQRVVEFSSENKTLQMVRDLFIFQAYTGLSYADMIKITREDIKLVRGKKYIVDKRQKTLQDYAIRLYPACEDILSKYDYNLNLITNQAYNRYLKSLAVIVGVREDLTSHMARHTFATIALNRGVPLAVVARMLGHSTTKCTEIYAQYLQRTIEQEGYDKLEDIFG